jgi:hypothetical protein
MLRRRESSAAAFFCGDLEQEHRGRQDEAKPGAPRRIVSYWFESNCFKVGQPLERGNCR